MIKNQRGIKRGEILGWEVSESGEFGPPLKKVFVFMASALSCMAHYSCHSKIRARLIGKAIHMGMAYRFLFSCFSNASFVDSDGGNLMSSDNPTKRQKWNAATWADLLRFLTLAPFCFVDFGSPFCPLLHGSDACRHLCFRPSAGLRLTQSPTALFTGIGASYAVCTVEQMKDLCRKFPVRSPGDIVLSEDESAELHGILRPCDNHSAVRNAYFLETHSFCFECNGGYIICLGEAQACRLGMEARLRRPSCFNKKVMYIQI